MPAVGKRDDVKARAIIRLGAISSADLAPTMDAQDDCLNGTIAWYDQLRPLKNIHQAAGDGVTRRFILTTLIAAWVKGTSEVARVAYVTSPDTNDEAITELELHEWQQTQAANGDDVLMLVAPVPTGTTLRVAWTSPHTVDADEADLTTIPTKDAEPFVSMLASRLAQWISRRASDLARPSLGADQVDMEPISERWKRRAQELAKDAVDRLAPPSENVSAAGASVEWRDESALTRSPRIGH